jgi:hypothetical protein
MGNVDHALIIISIAAVRSLYGFVALGVEDDATTASSVCEQQDAAIDVRGVMATVPDGAGIPAPKTVTPTTTV